uniref:Uncharacterized protein n=1 Tax=Lactuca sativa TaxID=4236 RepID=A0A9R1WML7_LACSA|nr:hypothetical protein LSAT_V11C100014990 [Lactuca sativa]
MKTWKKNYYKWKMISMSKMRKFHPQQMGGNFNCCVTWQRSSRSIDHHVSILNSEVELQKKTYVIMRESEAVLTFWHLESEERETFVKLMLEE